MKISAVQCDRCGKLYIPEKVDGWYIGDEERKPQTITHDRFDLCPDCQLSLKSWFRDGHAA